MAELRMYSEDTGRDEAQPPSMPPPNAHRRPKSRHMLDLSCFLANAMFLFLNPFLKVPYKIYIARKRHNRPACHRRTPTKAVQGRHIYAKLDVCNMFLKSCVMQKYKDNFMEKEDYLVTNSNTDAMTFISLCPKEANPQTLWN